MTVGAAEPRVDKDGDGRPDRSESQESCPRGTCVTLGGVEFGRVDLDQPHPYLRPSGVEGERVAVGDGDDGAAFADRSPRYVGPV